METLAGCPNKEQREDGGGGVDFDDCNCRPSKRMNLQTLLWERQTVGGTVVRPWTLSSRLAVQAWNPDRLRNMILTVGPGTPAGVIHAARLQNRASGGGGESESESEDEDDEEEEDPTSWIRLGHHHPPPQREHSDDDDDDENEEEEEDEQEEGNHTGDEEDEQGEEQRPMNVFDALEQSDEEELDDDPYLIRAALRARETDHEVAVNQQQQQQQRQQQQRQQQQQQQQQAPRWKHELRHLGCINTACWLDVSWRLAAPAGAAVSHNSNEATTVHTGSTDVPTQLATSGDDRMVKLWDARYAMGTATPIPGGWDTYSPLATAERPHQFQPAWKKHYDYEYSSSQMVPPAGSVIPLCHVATGHSGNVFHVTPLENQPGQLLTCAADGYLRCINVEQQSSSVVINPWAPISSNGNNFREAFDLLHSSSLAFSHTLLSQNTGLLCSDRGLHLFDLRLSPREQARNSLLDNNTNAASSIRSSLTGACKACAVWRPSGGEESHYVFAGGSCAVVELLDLRMDGSRRRLVEAYRPRHLRARPGDVSVSGLDVSKDGRELLVSYESDQIYAFPILARNKGASLAPPTLEDIDASVENSETRRPVTDVMGYGGHLNRFTFLKNARYAGPENEYVCTGSDSGHAWIFDRGTGTVVSLLSADTSTCNGVIPHKQLPFFITYGIDSTARLWRATTPVDLAVNDSSDGRALCALRQKYEMSPVASSNRVVQMLCGRFHNSNKSSSSSNSSSHNNHGLFLPDAIATRQEISSCGKFSAPNRRGMIDYDSPRIGNSLQSLPSILRSNRYECYRTAHTSGMGMPIDNGGLRPFCCRVALSRLQFQAQRLGITSFSMAQPWNFGAEVMHNNRDDSKAHYSNIHPADLVPDHPSDWILLDECMNPSPLSVDYWHANWSDWSEFLMGRDARLREFAQREDRENNDPPVWLEEFDEGEDDFSWPVRNNLIPPVEKNDPDGVDEDGDESGDNKEIASTRSDGTLYDDDDDDDDDKNGDDISSKEEEESDQDAALSSRTTATVQKLSEADKVRSQRFLYETALLLKQGGNVALKDEQFESAARRYDKAIQYCSVAFMNYCEGSGKELSHLKDGLCVDIGDSKTGSIRRLDCSVVVVWSPLLRVLITSRLNMALLFLKPQFAAISDAITQSVEALRLLKPFTVRPGAVVVTGEKDSDHQDDEKEPEEKFVFEDEPLETFRQARALQAKAYFRLGSAEMEQGNWSGAVDAFQHSIHSSEKPDALVTRRLQEAKAKRNCKKKRDRRRFEVALGSEDGDEEMNHEQRKTASK